MRSFEHGQVYAQLLAEDDPTIPERQRDLEVGHNKIGEVHLAQDDGVAALQAFQAALAMAEALAGRDPANIGAQVDLALSHGKVGIAMTPASERAQHLNAGLSILEVLAADGRLMPTQDHRKWFVERLAEIA